ncbi:uncharacterized protein LOC117173756 [Belonocnema kinseyi]|uniref:uncharacterized protein LOC117173756 n=1 Tax=Belonocnema kinseyi TaxID=2817044 RepID=UPI00143DB1FE|nr:uncharacterized protein LOC117173756 [Belonocnema kinseyi]
MKELSSQALLPKKEWENGVHGPGPNPPAIKRSKSSLEINENYIDGHVEKLQKIKIPFPICTNYYSHTPFIENYSTIKYQQGKNRQAQLEAQPASASGSQDVKGKAPMTK